MRSKGAIWTLAITLTLVCVYQLMFTLKTYQVRNKAKKYAQQFEPNIRDIKERQFLDSMNNEIVYNFLGLRKYTYQECQEYEINLGLDLKGGLSIILEVSVEDVIKALANNPQDSTINRAIKRAKELRLNSNEDFVSLFGKAFKELEPVGKLSAHFINKLRDKINYNSTNEEVLDVLKKEVNSAIENSFNIIRTRIDRFGVTQPNIQRLEGGERILVELPGIKDPERVKKLLGGTAKLEFWETYDNAIMFKYLVEANKVIKQYLEASETTSKSISTDTTQKIAVTKEEKPELLSEIEKTEKKDTTSVLPFEKENPLFSLLYPYITQDNRIVPGPIIGRAKGINRNLINKYLTIAMEKGIFPKDVKFFWSAHPVVDKETNKATDIYELYAIRVTTRDGNPPLDGSVITDAREGFDEYEGTSEVSMTMSSEGAKKWARLTKENVGKFIAIVMDSAVYSCPVVKEEITTGNTRISGNFTIKEAQDLANMLKSGSLPAPCKIVQEEYIGPLLGKQSINAGLKSFIIALLIVFLYMVFYYSRSAGLIADIALITNMFFLIGILASLGLALTLPGIAGIVLTIGMSVDANVIIFERIREELAAGKGTKLAISDGYKHSLSAILDANITTLITGIILFTLGTGPIKGFATTLVIGIITSLFSALFISRLIFEILLDKHKDVRFSIPFTEGAFKKVNLNFIGNRKLFYGISTIIVVISIFSLFTRGLDLGVDFKGGRNIVIEFPHKVSPQQIAQLLEKQFGARPTVITFGSERKIRITTRYKIENEDPDVDKEIQEIIYNGLKPLIDDNVSFEEFINKYWIMNQKVGPTIASDIKRQAVVAIFVSLIFMFLYIFIRFRNWQFGLGAVIALIHDSLITLGAFSLLHGFMPFSLEIDQSFVAAILTVIGYSVNDTVIVYDRIREFRKLFPKHDLQDTFNKAMNQTLSRTINTSLTTLFVILITFLFGGESIKGFAFALLIGIGIGTYSSIFVASNLVFDSLKSKINEKK